MKNCYDYKFEQILAKRPIKTSNLPQSKLLFIIRIQGYVTGYVFFPSLFSVVFIVSYISFFVNSRSDMRPETRKLLYSLRLRRMFTGVFVKANDRILNVLQKVEPCMTYRFCSTGLTSDIVVEVEDMSFHLHKALVEEAKASYEKAVFKVIDLVNIDFLG